MADTKAYKALANIYKQLSDELGCLRLILEVGEDTTEDHVAARFGLPPSSLIDGAERFQRNKAESLTRMKRVAQRLVSTVDMIEQYDNAKAYIGCVSEQK